MVVARFSDRDEQLRTLRTANEELSARVAALGAQSARVASLEAELADTKRHLEEKNRLQRELDREVVELRTIAAETERQLAGIRRTLAYRVGQALVNAMSWRGFWALPWRLFQIWNGLRLKRKGPAMRAIERPADRLRFVDETLKRLQSGGIEAALKHARGLTERYGHEKARALVELGLAVHTEVPELAGRLGADAAKLNPRENRLRTLVFDLYDVGAVGPAAMVLADASSEILQTPAHQQRATMIRSDADELRQSFSLPPKAAREGVRARKLAVVVARSLPNHAEALTYRAQGIALAAIAAGWEAITVTEPGYQSPPDARGQAFLQPRGEGLTTLRLPVGHAHPSALEAYVHEASSLIEAQLVAQDIGLVCIMTDGAIPLAMAAATGARRAGLDYVLDIGMVPAVGAPGRAEWEKTDRFAAQVSRLKTIASGASGVLFRAQTIADLLQPQLGFDGAVVVPETVPRGFVRATEAGQRDVRRELGGIEDARPIVGVFGGVGGEEGVTQIVEAMSAIHDKVPEACMIFCGPSRVGHSVRRIAAQRGIAESVIVPDGFVRQRLAHYISAFTAVVVPKQGGRTAGLSMPIELGAAFAIGTPAVVSDPHLLREWKGAAGEAPCALADGTANGIAHEVIAILSDPARAATLTATARARIEERADPERVFGAIAAVLDRAAGVQA